MMGGGRKIRLDAVAHPTDQLIVCEDCGESCAGFTTMKEAADWVEKHLAERHGR